MVDKIVNNIANLDARINKNSNKKPFTMEIQITHLLKKFLI